VGTRFPELDAVLADLVAGVRGVLGESLVGVYLQGSFALGDADEHSDVDFIVVLERELTEAEQAALQELHGQLHGLPTTWAQHLEGSYVTRALLRRVDPARTPLFYLDNGSSELVWDSHCNTALVRWSLREHGVTLAGPEPTTLVDPVPEDALQAEARAVAAEWVEWLAGVDEWNRWLQPYTVLTYCRLLYTAANGRIVSKGVAGEWAIANLDPEWTTLIRQALDDRPDPVGRYFTPAPPKDVARTLEFVRYASSALS
jgi:hypothetical protein